MFSFCGQIGTVGDCPLCRALKSSEVTAKNVVVLFNRGGLYALNEAIFFTFMVFIFIGILDLVKAMPTIVNIVFKRVKKRWTLIISSLIATAFTNAFTSNQSATSFIIGDAFKPAYDKLKVSRKVLSRSIEDYGTMIETLIPWHASSLYVDDCRATDAEPVPKLVKIKFSM